MPAQYGSLIVSRNFSIGPPLHNFESEFMKSDAIAIFWYIPAGGRALHCFLWMHWRD